MEQVSAVAFPGDIVAGTAQRTAETKAVFRLNVVGALWRRRAGFAGGTVHDVSDLIFVVKIDPLAFCADVDPSALMRFETRVGFILRGFAPIDHLGGCGLRGGS